MIQTLRRTEETVVPRHIGCQWEASADLQPRILSVMQSFCPANYAGRCQSPYWTLDYSYTPFGRWRAGSLSAPWRGRPAHEAHLYRPGTPYWEDTRTAGVPQTHGIFILFSAGQAALCPDLAPLRVACFQDGARRLGFLLEQLLELGVEHGTDGFADAQALLWNIFGLLNSAERSVSGCYQISAADQIPPATDFLHRLHAYLREHLSERVTLDALARHLSLSVSVLSHRYRQETGETPLAALMRLRLQLVKTLLLKGQPLKQIAEQTGFYDEYHLSRTFKRQEGLNTREFKRQTQKSET